MNIFIQDTLYFLPSFQKNRKNGALHGKGLSKYALFITFSLFLAISGMCNISNKYWLPNKPAKQNFWHKSTSTPLLHFKTNSALNCRIFQKHPIFTTFLQVAIVDEVYLSYQNSEIWIFLHKIPYIFLCFKKTWRSPWQRSFEITTFYHIFSIFQSKSGV